MFTGRLKTEIPLALEALVEALEGQKHLVELDLSDNAFGPAVKNFNSLAYKLCRVLNH